MTIIVSLVLLVVCLYFFISVYTSYSDYRKEINSELDSNKIIKRFYVKSAVFIVSATAFVTSMILPLYRSFYVVEKTISSKVLSSVQLDGFLSVICTFLFSISFVASSYFKIMVIKAKYNNDAKKTKKYKIIKGLLIAASVLLGAGAALFILLYYLPYSMADIGEKVSGGFPDFRYME